MKLISCLLFLICVNASEEFAKNCFFCDENCDDPLISPGEQINCTDLQYENVNARSPMKSELYNILHGKPNLRPKRQTKEFVCVKIRWQILNEKPQLTRTCVPLLETLLQDTTRICTGIVKNNEIEVLNCDECYSDYCNSQNRSAVTLILITLNVLLAILFM